MLLAANVGNSTVKVAPIEGPRAVGRVARFPTSRAISAPALADDLAAGGHRAATLEGIVFVTVVPSYATAFGELASAHGVPLFEATSATIPIEARVDAPESVGADRLLNAWAAGELYGTPAIVVDFGTATTVNAVAADGAYVGGAIAPGLALGLEALAARTAALPLVDPAWPERAAARDTVDAMRSGAVIGHLGAVRELVSRIREELLAGAAAETRVRIVLAGGLASAPWWSQLGAVDAVDPDLTLRGLALLQAAQPAAASR